MPDATPHVIEMKIEPKSKADVSKLLAALERIAAADPTFGFSVDAESDEIIVGGSCELHLDIKIEELHSAHGIAVSVGAPQVCYLEEPIRLAEVEIASDGGARVKLRIEPNGAGGGCSFEMGIADDDITDVHFDAVSRAINSVWNSGVVVGCPVVDCKVTLLGGSFDDETVPPIAIEVVTRRALQEAFEKAGMKVLEPIMAVEITTPSQNKNVVLSDVDSRRGVVKHTVERIADVTISAEIPAGNMFGYVSQLRSLTAGLGTYKRCYSHHAELPRNIASPDPDRFPPAVGMRA